MPATMLFNDHHRAQLAHRLNRSLDDTRNRARRAAEARRTNGQLDEVLEAVSECTISAVAPAPGAKLMMAGGGA